MKHSCVFALLLGAGIAVAGAAPGDQATAPARADVPVTLTLRIAGARQQFRPGETIPIELTFESSVRQRYVVDGATYDRSGRLTIDEFRIEPLGPVTDPLLDLFATYLGYIGGGIRTNGTLGEKPFTVTVDLNEWFRFDTPGVYRLSVRSNRVTDETQRTLSFRPVAPVDSNATAFEILPRDAAWEAAEIARALQALDAPPNTRGVEPRAACRTLRFLATDAAVDEMIRRYDDQRCQWDFMAGLYSAADRARVVRVMEAGLSAPDQPINQSYLRTLAGLSVYVQHPELRAAQTPETKGRLVPGGPITKRTDLLEQAEARYAETLAAALPKKTPSARAISVAELRAVRGGATGNTSVTTANLQQQLIRGFPDLPSDRQTRLLEYEWRSVAHADMLPVLRRLADGSGPLADLALRRLYELDASDGRARILREIGNPRPGASLKTLGQLPDAELPQLDTALAANVERAFDDIHAALLHRYASPAVAPRMLASLASRIGIMACQPQSYVLAYFLRAAPGDGTTLLDRVLASRERTGCYQFVLHDTAALHMTPAIEAAALRHLDDPHPRVVMNAIDTLGHFGSAAARQPLRSRFERWSGQWRGRQDELRYNVLGTPDQPGAAQGMIESAYVRALGTGLGWLTSASELTGVRALCVTDSCRSQVDGLAGSAGGLVIRVTFFENLNDLRANLAQYELSSYDALRQKLRQYAKGTRFTSDLRNLDPQAAARVSADLARLAGELGVEVVIASRAPVRRPGAQFDAA